MSMFWNIQLCGEEVRKYEVARGKTYAWVVRTRPDTAFPVPLRAPTEAALQTHGGLFCRNNDAFFVASASTFILGLKVFFFKSKNRKSVS